MALPFVVGKKAQAPNGITVLFEVTGPAGRTVPIGVEGGRAKPLDAAPATPTVRLTMDVETLNCLGCGRWEPEQALAAGKVRIAGDSTLGETIVRQMNFMI
jgi:putative sterol carrier protein